MNIESFKEQVLSGNTKKRSAYRRKVILKSIKSPKAYCMPEGYYNLIIVMEEVMELMHALAFCRHNDDEACQNIDFEENDIWHLLEELCDNYISILYIHNLFNVTKEEWRQAKKKALEEREFLRQAMPQRVISDIYLSNFGQMVSKMIRKTQKGNTYGVIGEPVSPDANMSDEDLAYFKYRHDLINATAKLELVLKVLKKDYQFSKDNINAGINVKLKRLEKSLKNKKVRA